MKRLVDVVEWMQLQGYLFLDDDTIIQQLHVLSYNASNERRLQMQARPRTEVGEAAIR